MNPIEVELPDGRIVEFPAGTPRDVMDREIQGLIARESKPPQQDTGLSAAANTATIGLGGLYEGVSQLGDIVTGATAGATRVLPDPRKHVPEWMARDIFPTAPLGPEGVKKAFDLRNTFRMLGAPVGTPEQVARERNIPLTTLRKNVGNIAATTGSALTSAVPFMAAARVPAALNAAPTLSQAMLAPFRNAPVASTAATAASGASAGALGEVAENFGAPELKPLAQTAGSFLPVAVTGAVRAGRSVAEPLSLVARARSPETARDVAGQTLRELGLTPQTAVPRPPIPGMRATTGMLTDNPDLIALERAALGRVGNMSEIAAMKDVNRSVIDDAVARASGNLTPTEASKRMAAAYRGRAEEVGDAARAAYQPLEDELFRTKIASNIVRTRISGFYKGLDRNELKDIPGDIRGRLNMLQLAPKDKAPTVGEIDGVRSRALAEAKALRDAGQRQKARTLDKVATFLDDVIAKAPASTEKKAALDPARTQYREYMTAYEDNPLVGNLFERGRGGYRVPGSEFAPRAFNSPDEALSHLVSVGPDNARKLGARYLTSVLRQSLQGNVDDFTRAKVNQFLISNRDALRHFYSADDWKAIVKVRDAVTLNARWAKGTGWSNSPTAEKLMANRFVDKLVVDMLPWGRGLVARGGETLARNAQNLLTQAAFDPQLARALVLRPTRGSLAFIPKQVRERHPTLIPVLSSLLGQTAGSNTSQSPVPLPLQ